LSASTATTSEQRRRAEQATRKRPKPPATGGFGWQSRPDSNWRYRLERADQDDSDNPPDLQKRRTSSENQRISGWRQLSAVRTDSDPFPFSRGPGAAQNIRVPTSLARRSMGNIGDLVGSVMSGRRRPEIARRPCCACGNRKSPDRGLHTAGARSTVTVRSRAAATLWSVVNVAPTPPASRRATAA